MDNSNSNFLNILNALSLVIGIQNLQENREQSAHNDIQTANDEQAKYMLSEITRQFEIQNKLLNEILKILRNES